MAQGGHLAGHQPTPPRRLKSRPRLRRLAGGASAYLVLLVLCGFILLPVGWMLTAALKPDLEPVYTVPPEWFPTTFWHWSNFSHVLFGGLAPFDIYFRNTLLIVGANIIGTLFSCSLAAFAFARLRFRGRRVLFYVVIITMLVPAQALILPQFLMFNELGWINTYWPLIIPSFGGNPFYIFLIRQYMITFPRELDEAALIDGASYWQIYRYIALPLSVPVLVVVCVFVFITTWNDLLNPLIYLNDGDKFTVSIGLANLATQYGSAKTNQLMAATLLAAIPALVLYFALQKRLIGGIASVGLKG